MLGNRNRADPQKFGHGDSHFLRSINIDRLIVGAELLNELEAATLFRSKTNFLIFMLSPFLIAYFSFRSVLQEIFFQKVFPFSNETSRAISLPDCTHHMTRCYTITNGINLRYLIHQTFCTKLSTRLHADRQNNRVRIEVDIG